MILRQRKRSVKVKSDEKITVRTFTEPFIYLLPFILVVSVFMVFPIITVFLNAFLENYDYLANTYTGMGMGNFAALFSDKEFLLSLKNTFLYVAFVVPLSTVIALTVAILLNQKLKGSSFFQFVYFLPMVTATIAVGIVWKWMYHYDYGIINYVTIVKLHQIDTYKALIVPYTANILYIFILRNFFLEIPGSLYNAARVDGASNWKFLWRIMVPIAKPAIITIILLNSIDSWNSFLWPMLVTNESRMRTVTVGLTSFVQSAGIRYERLMAAAFIVVIPMVVLFFFARKYIVTAVAQGGIKG